MHRFPNVLGVFGRGRDQVGNRDGGHGDGCAFFSGRESWVGGQVEEEEVEGRDVMDALQAGAPAAHGTRLETLAELHLGLG